MPQPQRPTDNAFMVNVQPADTPKHQLGDIIVGAFGLTGALVLAAVLSGTLLAGLWIVWRKARRPFDADAPPSIGSVAIGADAERKIDQRPDR